MFKKFVKNKPFATDLVKNKHINSAVTQIVFSQRRVDKYGNVKYTE